MMLAHYPACQEKERQSSIYNGIFPVSSNDEIFKGLSLVKFFFYIRISLTSRKVSAGINFRLSTYYFMCFTALYFL